VKLFSLLKIPAIVLGFGAAVVFTPTCKAQSEVSPDHFDGTDPWEIAARKPSDCESQADIGKWFIPSAEQEDWLGRNTATCFGARTLEVHALQRRGSSGQT